MNYEYKEEILSDIGPEPNFNYESESNRYYDKIDELEHVYAQAAKADEYEAKARILDRVKEFATEPPFLLANNEHEDYEHYAYDQILRLIEKYESSDKQ